MSNKTLLERAALFNKHDWHGFSSTGTPHFCAECQRLAKFIEEQIEEALEREWQIGEMPQDKALRGLVARLDEVMESPHDSRCLSLITMTGKCDCWRSERLAALESLLPRESGGGK